MQSQGNRRRIRIGLIGCGFYAQNHLHAWRDLAGLGADLVALCDQDQTKARTAGERFGASWLAVHENFRFATSMRRVKQVIASGTIGEPSWARIAFRTGYDVYKGQPYFYDEKRLAILDVGIHVLDLARVFLGEVERVYCE